MIVHFLRHFANASSMAGGRVCSSSCTFQRDFPPLALSFSVECSTPNSMAKSWNDVPSRSLFSKVHCIFSSIASFFSCGTLTRGMAALLQKRSGNMRGIAVAAQRIRLPILSDYPPGTLAFGIAHEWRSKQRAESARNGAKMALDTASEMAPKPTLNRPRVRGAPSATAHYARSAMAYDKRSATAHYARSATVHDSEAQLRMTTCTATGYHGARTLRVEFTR